MTGDHRVSDYFRYVIPVSRRYWRLFGLRTTSRKSGERRLSPAIFYLQLAMSLNKTSHSISAPVAAADLTMFATLQTVYRYMVDVLAEEIVPGVIEQALRLCGYDPEGGDVQQLVERFMELFPPEEVLSGELSAAVWLQGGSMRRYMVLREIILVRAAATNPAMRGFYALFDEEELAQSSHYGAIAPQIEAVLIGSPFVPLLACSLGEALRAPLLAAPDSLADQIRYIRDNWGDVLPSELCAELAAHSSHRAGLFQPMLHSSLTSRYETSKSAFV